jgi:hypothetical protein
VRDHLLDETHVLEGQQHLADRAANDGRS